MRLTMLALSLAAAACSGQLNSPTSPAPGAGNLSAASARAATGLPFKGSFTGSSSATFVPPITLRITGILEGTATQLGRFTAATVDNVDTTNNTATGTYTFTAADGAQLRATTVGVENEFVPPNISEVTIAATIVGGTGRFEAATGRFMVRITEVIDFITNTATRSGSFEGQLNLNN
jgi:hypothetical protein